MIIKVNVHPSPTVKDFDYHVPYVAGPYRNANKEVRHGPEVFVQNLVSKLGNHKSVVLCNNGEPYSRLDMCRLAVEKYAPDIHVTMERSNNPGSYQKPDLLFSDRKGYRKITNVIDRTLSHEAIDYYLSNWQNMEQVSQRVHDRDHGFFPYNNMLWYNYGAVMPDSDNPINTEMNRKLQLVWNQVSTLCKELFKEYNIPACDIDAGLNLRIVHNSPTDQDDDGCKFFKHIDGSLITGWLYENPSGAYVGVWETNDQKESQTKMVQVQDLYNQDSTDLLIIPGSAWCDYCDTDTSATWHEVKLSPDFKDQRVSLVFLLRNPSFEKTTYKFDDTTL